MRKVAILIISIAAVMAFLSACAAPTPQVVEKVVEKVVTQVVEKTVVETVEVEKIVELVVTATPEPRPAADVDAIQAAWEGSPHNSKYDLYHGPNTYCARCHSPQNWDPAAKVGPPPNCFSCKFPTDKEVRISKFSRLLEENEWKPVGCEVCHPVVDGKITGELAVWNNATKTWDPVANSTALCEKCHTDSLGGTRHKIRLGGGAHSNQVGQTAMRPELCTDCHNPHSLKADCNSCHGPMLEGKEIEGHDANHANVKCVACHDATDAKVGPAAKTGIWNTGTVSSRGTLTEATSHDFQKDVTCTRCHFDDNPNNLRSLVTPTAVPAAPAPTATPAK